MNESLIGSQVGGYRIERILGRGGMASVYFAWDTRASRAVALKVMDERYRDTAGYVERFINEAKAIVSCDHPHIVRVFDAGEENQIYYYAMEFIRGLDLAQLLRQYLDAGQLMPYSEVMRIGQAVASALDYAHSRGIIHRDVKPSNVLVSVDGRILLSDFGLVMDIARGTLGETFGSPAYIAPEQARSSAGAVPQSDIYSLGVMLYEMLTGAVLFHDSSPTALALKHLTEEPPRPRSLNPRLTPVVEAVLLRALRKLPRERYANGREMMIALERGLGEALVTTQAAAPQPLSSQTQALHTQRARPYGDARPAPNPVALPPIPQQGGWAAPRDPVAPPPFRSGPPGAYPPQAGGVRNDGVRNDGANPGRSRRSGWGCLAGGLAVLALVVMAAAAAAFNGAGRGLLPGLFPGAAVPTAPVLAANTPTAEPTGAPAATTAPELPTPTPSLTATATATLSPTTTATPTATVTMTASVTPLPALALMMAHQKEDGFLLVNSGALDLPLPALELHTGDKRNRLLLSGEAWEVQALKPGECVSMWVKGAKAEFPPGVRCTRVGKNLTVVNKDRFWTNPVALYYNEELLDICEIGETRCEYTIEE